MLRDKLVEATNDERWNAVPISVDNDTNLSGISSYLREPVRDRDMVFIKWMAGLRVALIVDGRLHRGVKRAAGELPHIDVGEGFPPCDSPNCPVPSDHGCVFGA